MKGLVVAAPCKACPFRKDVPIYLRETRRQEIAHALLSGNSFACHNQVDYTEEDDEGNTIADSSSAEMCAGAAKSLLLADCDNNIMRIAERLGAFDPERQLTVGADVWDIHRWQTVPEGATGEDPGPEPEDIETCNTVNEGCYAPAGYALGNGVAYGTEPADDNCTECGEACCSNCLNEDGLCGYCAPWDDN